MLTYKEKKNFNIEEMEIEDSKPVDNIFSEKQMRLLTEPLYTSWKPKEHINFLVTANVGIFTEILENPIVPDVLLSLEVDIPESRKKKEDLCYYLDKIGKAPEVVIEIVSNKEGNELDSKLKDYGKIGVLYYTVYDPDLHILKGNPVSSFKYKKGMAFRIEKSWFEEVGLGLRLWDGIFENQHGTWLRWCDYFGEVIPTGKELAELERRKTAIEQKQRIEAQKQRMEAQKQAEVEKNCRMETQKQAEIEKNYRMEAQRQVEHLAQKLRELGFNPEQDL
ncbi:MAG: Uma2 family endonuclease [Leptospiraceae bacterium]|nr:Uma2 family endonuclease [Leptospiraceae bacterium]